MINFIVVNYIISFIHLPFFPSAPPRLRLVHFIRLTLYILNWNEHHITYIFQEEIYKKKNKFNT